MVNKTSLPLLLLAVFAYGSFLLSSCSSSGPMAGLDANYTQLLSPEDGMIIHLDLERLNDKLDMEAITSHPSFESLMQLGGSGATSSFFENFNASGINTNSTVVMSISGFRDDPKVKIYAELESEEKLKEVLLKNGSRKVQKAGGVNYVSMNNANVCWDNGLVCFLSGISSKEIESTISTAFVPQASLRGSDKFKGYETFLSKKADMHIWTSYGTMLQEIPRESEAVERATTALKDTYNGYRLDFEKGNISIDMEMYSTDQELIDSWKDAYKQAPDSELTEMVPSNAIALIHTSLDPTVLNRIYKGNLSDLFSMAGLDKSGRIELIMQEFQEAWDGDMMLAVTGLGSEKGKLSPDMLIGASTKADNPIDSLLMKLSREGILRLSGDGEYRIANSPFETKLSVRGDKLIAVTGDPALVYDQLDPALAKHLSSSPLVFHIDIHRLMDELGDAQGGMAMMMISGFVKSNFDYLLAYAIEPSNDEIVGAAHMDFKFVNEEDYSINVLANLLLDLFSTFGSLILQS